MMQQTMEYCCKLIVSREGRVFISLQLRLE